VVIVVLLVIVGVLAAAVITVVLVGALLPTAHTVTRSVTLPQSPGTVWTTITDIDGYPSWRPGVRSVKRLPDGRWQEYDGRQLITYEVTEAQAPIRLVTRIADDNLPFGGTWTYAVTPTPDGGSTVTVTEDGAVYNPIFRFVSRFVMGHAATVDKYLAALAGRPA
jgi:hypothetical protein